MISAAAPHRSSPTPSDDPSLRSHDQEGLEDRPSPDTGTDFLEDPESDWVVVPRITRWIGSDWSARTAAVSGTTPGDLVQYSSLRIFFLSFIALNVSFLQLL